MKWVKRILLTLVVLIIVAAGVGFWLAWSSLPKIDGTIVVTKLGKPVKIIRDANAIPHIEAESINDAAFGLGFVHAQDRLWQMEMNRRLAQGRMSEVLGRPTVGIDRFLRTLGFDNRSKEAYSTLTAESRGMLDAYAAGVNAFLETNQSVLPPEFLILGVSPEPWQPHHSIGWLKMMALDLGGNYTKELARMEAAKHLNPKQMAQFFAAYPQTAPIALAKHLPFYRTMGKQIDLAGLRDALPSDETEGIGSNNWVVAGHRSETGKPLLANDPHLGLTVPAVWYFAHMKTPQGELIGATLPGVPGIILGTNGKMAWGFTNTAPDVQDLFIEKVDPKDPKNYMTPDGPVAFKVRKEIIRVSGDTDQVLEVRETRHGPVISDVHGRTRALADDKHVIAMQWTTLDANDTSADLLYPLFGVDRPSTFINSLKAYVAPQQNMVFADVVGNIGYIAPGRVPVRKPENDISGKMPAKGWEAKYDWNGTIPYGELPRVINPPSGYVMTANNRVVPWDYPHFITDDWAPPYRARQAEVLIKQTPKHSIASFKAMQLDVTSQAALDLMPLMLKPMSGETDQDKAIFKAMAAWKGAMDADRPEPLIYATWYRELTRLIAKDELGDAFERNWKERAVFVTGVLKDTDGASEWCKVKGDNTTCDKLIADAYGLAIKWLTEKYGSDWQSWKWGDAHRWVGEHRPFSQVKQLAWFFGLVHPSSGDTHTLNVARVKFTDDADPFKSTHGPSLRAIYDLSNIGNSVFIHSSGQSGHPLSAHYSDLAELWAKGEYVPIRITPEAYKDGAIGTLVLQPK